MPNLLQYKQLLPTHTVYGVWIGAQDNRQFFFLLLNLLIHAHIYSSYIAGVVVASVDMSMD